MQLFPGEFAAPTLTGEATRGSTAAGRYEELASDKLIYLQRARQCSRVTIPMIFPPQGHSSATNYYTPFQAIGAIGLNNLTSKLILVLFPPGEPFFRLVLAPKIKKGIRSQQKDEQDGKDIRADLEKGLGLAEDDIAEVMEGHGARIALTEGIQQMLVSGNFLLEVKDDNHFVAHHLENYVVRRDVDGHPIEVIIRQTLKRQSLPDEAQAFLETIEKTGRVNLGQRSAPGSETSSADRAVSMEPGNIDLFTWAYVVGKGKRRKWRFHQELQGFEVPDTDGEWPIDAPGFIPVCWRRIQGEHYGRGFVEQYLGDLNSLEALSQTLVEGAGIAGQVKFVVDETGLTSIQQIADAPNGQFVNGEVENGKPKNVGVVQVDKQMDFNFLITAIEKLETRLNMAFLKVQTRDAERVTAEEIREVAKELEAALGGQYAILSQELQRPIVKRVIKNMQTRGEIKTWPKDTVRAEVVAGLEGLGREQQAKRLITLITSVAQAFGPQAMAAETNIGSFMERLATAMDVDPDGLFKSDQQKQQEAQAQQTQVQQKALGPSMVKAASDQAKDIRGHNPDIEKQPGGALGVVAAQTAGQHIGTPQPPPPAAS